MAVSHAISYLQQEEASAWQVATKQAAVQKVQEEVQELRQEQQQDVGQLQEESTQLQEKLQDASCSLRQTQVVIDNLQVGCDSRRKGELHRFEIQNVLH